jgi:hypothetical protein
MYRIASCLVVLLSFMVTSCGDQVQKAKPPERGTPELPHGHPPLDTLPAGHPPIDKGAPRPGSGADPFSEGGAASKPAMQPQPAGDPAKVLFAGDVSIDPAVKLGPKYVVYLSAILGPDEKGPLYIKRYDNPKFPFPFEIRETDAGMGKTPAKSDKPLYLRVMISDTGDAMNTRNRTVSATSFALGSKDIHLTIKP